MSSAQAARNLKASVLAQLGNPEPNDIILELSDESYYLDATREWTFSQQAMQVVDDQVVVDTVLDQPLGALRDVSYQLFCGDEILESAFEQRPDKLCVARQLAELMRLPVQEVLSDFDAITGIGSKWQEQGITPREIRSFCVWRQAPMFYVDCQGRLLDNSSSLRSRSSGPWPSRAGTATPSSTNPPAPSRGASRSGTGPRPNTGTRGSQAKRRSSRTGGSGRARSAAYAEDLEQVRRELLAEGHCPKVVMRSMREWRCLRLRVRGGERTASSAPSTKTWRCCRPGWAGWGSPIAGSAWRARRARSSFTCSGIRPGLGRVSAGRARGAGSPVQALRGAHHRGDVRAGPHRPRAPVLLRTVPPEQNGLGVLARHDAGVPLQPAGLRGLRGIAPAAPAGLQAQQPQAGLRGPEGG